MNSNDTVITEYVPKELFDVHIQNIRDKAWIFAPLSLFLLALSLTLLSDFYTLSYWRAR